MLEREYHLLHGKRIHGALRHAATLAVAPRERNAAAVGARGRAGAVGVVDARPTHGHRFHVRARVEDARRRFVRELTKKRELTPLIVVCAFNARDRATKGSFLSFCGVSSRKQRELTHGMDNLESVSMENL